MSFEARLVRGNPHLAPHVASGAVAAGEVLVRGDRCVVAHPTGIADGATGSVAIFGGEWELVKDGTSGPIITLDDEVGWIAGSNLASDVLTSNAHFGPCTVAAGTNDAHVTAFLNPRGDLNGNETS